MPSFDVVSRVDMQEMDNAVNQVKKEIGTRFDFRGSKTRIDLDRKEAEIHVLTEDDMKLRAIKDMLIAKVVRRSIEADALVFGPSERASGDMLRQTVTVTNGIDVETARKVVKVIKDTKLKVQAAIQGDEVRVTGKKRDDLQEAIQALKEADLGLPFSLSTIVNDGPVMIDSHMPDGRVFFPGDQRLEGILEWPSIQPDASADIDAGAQLSMGQQTAMGGNAVVKGGVVIAHPYPPHGATMAQPVVYRIAASSRRRGLASLRFNFRGVGGSLGSFSGEEEHRDVLAAAAFLAGRLAALDDAEGREDPRPLALAGYSFGSIMAARAAAESPVPVKALALVGFVVSWEHTPGDTFERLAAYRGPVLAVCAENDDLGRPKDVERVLTDLKLDFRMSIVEGAGHFLEGRHRQVGETVAAFLSEALASGG